VETERRTRRTRAPNLSVCLSVTYLSFTQQWKVVESLYFRGIYHYYANEWWCNSKTKRSKVKVTVNENVQIVFRAYVHQIRIDLRQTKTKMINGPLYSVSPPSPPAACRFLTFFDKRLRILNQFIHTYCTFPSTLDYKFSFSYLNL